MNGETQRVVLVGAGFSKQFGGFLANEVSDQVLNLAVPGMISGAQLLKLMSEEEWNYEDILGELELDNGQKSDQAAFLSLVLKVFEEMDLTICREAKSKPELRGNAICGLNNWLRSSNNRSIFTLNQDTLFERNWRVPNSRLVTPGIALWEPNPGVGCDENPEILMPLSATQHYPDTSTKLVKLHGSVNWAENGSRIFVSGRNKVSAISGFSLLRDYFDCFESIARADHTEVLIIGYGFGDSHVNTVLRDVIRGGGTLLILDPNAYRHRRRLLEPLYIQGTANSDDGAKSLQQAVARVKTVSCTLSEALSRYPQCDRPWVGIADFLND